MAVLWQETFTYANGTSPSTLQLGVTGSGGVVNVQSNALSLKTGTGTWGVGEVSRRTNLAARLDAEISGTYTPLTGGSQVLMLRHRAASAMNGASGYRMMFDFYHDTVGFFRDVNWVETQLAPSIAFPQDFGVAIKFRFRVVGSSVKCKFWTGATEPAAWNVDVTDPSPYSVSAYVGFGFWAGTAASTAKLDDLIVTDGKEPATANAGVDVTVNSDQSFSLSGSATGTSPAYSWSLPGMKSIAGANTLNPTMVAPIVGADTVYMATLTVTPSGGTAVTDTASITVKGTGLYGHTPAGASIAYVWK